MRDPQAYADVVVLAIKSALAPVLERLAATEAQLKVLGDVRDRVVAVETKAALPVTERPAIDLTPVLERVAAAEARLAVLGDLRDRVVTVETKAAMPVAAEKSVDLAPVLDRIVALEVGLQMKFRETEPVLGTIADHAKAIAAVSERVAVVEVRAQVPGPAGTDGQDGKDGADGLGFDDLVAVQQDDRSFTIKAMRGDRVKDIGTARFPVQIQRGVYVDGKSYEPGDMVTWAGSQWHCNEATNTKPGDGLKAWTLVVKRGRDGKDGRDAVTVPVVSIGRPQ